MSDSTYQYFVKPVNGPANEAIANLLNQRGHSASSLETQSIEVDGKRVEGVYLAPDHAFVTTVGRSVHRRHVRVYVQQGLGAARPYVLFKNIGRNLAGTKSVKTAKAAIAKMKR